MLVTVLWPTSTMTAAVLQYIESNVMQQSYKLNWGKNDIKSYELDGTSCGDADEIRTQFWYLR